MRLTEEQRDRLLINHGFSESDIQESYHYIRQFRFAKVIIKYGGAALNNSDFSDEFLKDVATLKIMNIDVILVHGGSLQLNALMQKKGLQPQIINGMRVTDQQTLELAIQAFGQVNNKIVRALLKEGIRASSLKGEKSGLIMAKQCGKPELGFVGEVEQVNLEVLEALPGNRLPVMTCLGRGRDGQVYNINADHVASALAIEMQAQKFVCLSDVDGVLFDRDDPKSLIPSLNARMVEEYIQTGIINAGMIPKVKSAIDMLEGGVDKVHIINGTRKHSLLFEILTDRGIGTEIIL